MARRRFFVDKFERGSAALEGDDAQHLARVLRAQPGQRFELSDNRSVQLAEIIEISPRRVLFRVIETVAAAHPPVRIMLVAALIKFDRFEWMVEKATELGVEAIVPVEAERTDKGLLEAARKRVERWRKIARESSQQARRAKLPAIGEPARLDPGLAEGYTWRFLLDEDPGTAPLAGELAAARHGDSAALLIGPEGGWTARERESLIARWKPVSLGGQILRAETAAIASLAVVMSLWPAGELTAY